VNNEKYGFVDVFKLPEEPIVDKSFWKGEREIKMFKLFKICGTCIAKDKSKSTVSLLTPSGVITVKFRKEHFALFDKQISVKQPDGTKKVAEKSWFNRGSMIIIQGIRSKDVFLPKKYASTVGHQLYKITKVLPNGELEILDKRYSEGEEDE
jgi:DNA polymerase-3 subunit alpha